MPRHKYFSKNPDKIKDQYYRGQTEEKGIEEKTMAPKPVNVKTNKKSDRTKALSYNSTAVLEERRRIRQSKKDGSFYDVNGTIGRFFEPFGNPLDKNYESIMKQLEEN